MTSLEDEMSLSAMYMRQALRADSFDVFFHARPRIVDNDCNAKRKIREWPLDL